MRLFIASFMVSTLSLVGVALAQQPATQPGGRGAMRQAPQINLPKTIQAERDINYAGGKNPAQTLDLLLPTQSRGDKLLPVVVYIHGGAFRVGDKAMGLRDIIPLVASGDYVGVTINYRLSGEAIWPAAIYDCKAAVRWVRANAAKYHYDPDHIGLIGSSAGGHLVAMMGTSGGIDSLEGDVGPNTGISSKVQCVVDEFGPTELLAMGDYPSKDDHNAASSPESLFIGGPLQENKEKARAASPITYVARANPPFLIIHGDKDPLVPFNQSERLTAALKKVEVDCLFVKVTGAGHGGFRSPEVPKRVRQFFDKHLRGKKETISEEAIPNSP